jgi:hypothetical protein
MIKDNLLYYIALSYNYATAAYTSTLEYLSELTIRVNNLFIGESNQWVIGQTYSLRLSDIAPILLPLAQGYLYIAEKEVFIKTGTRVLAEDAGKKFTYIGGEYKLNETKYDFTDWLNKQRWIGSEAPSPRQILMGWLIKTNQLGFMLSESWKQSECILVDSLGDDQIHKME